MEYLSDAKNEEKAISNFLGVLVGSRVSEDFKNKVLTQSSDEMQPQEFRIIMLNRFRNTTTGDSYVLVNKMMKQKTSSNKDTTTYRFDNQENLSKGRLVNAVVKYYAKQHSPISYVQLLEKFPDDLQGGSKFGVFREVSVAQEENDKDRKHFRYYTADDLVIELSDAKIATCNNWYGGAGKNMEKFISHATKELGLKIEQME